MRVNLRFSSLTTVLVSRFLIDLHNIQKKKAHQETFLSLDVMSRLGTTQSAVFHHSTASDSTDDILENDGEESTYSHENDSIDYYDV